MKRKLDARTEISVAVDRVRQILVTDPQSVLADPSGARSADRRHHTVTLTADIGEGAGARHQVLLEIDPPDVTDDEVRWPLRWAPASHRRALPVFEGELVATATADGTEIAVVGTYEPPFGAVGAFGDGVLGRRVAQSCADNLVADIAARVRSHLSHDERRRGFGPTPYPPDLRP